MKRYLTLLLCFFVFAPFAVAQDDAPNPEQEQANMRKQMEGMEKLQFRLVETMVKAYADGSGTLFDMNQFQHDDEYLSHVGVGKDDMNEINRFMREEIENSLSSRLDPLVLQAAETDDEAKLKTIGDEFTSIFSEAIDKAKDKIEKTLSPEQITNIRLAHLQLGATERGPAEQFPIVDFQVYSLLDLSDEQRQKIADIRAKFEKEQFAFLDKVMKQVGEFMKEREANPDKMAEITKEQEKLAEEGKQLVARIKTEIESVLTKSQLADWKKIQTDLPPYVVKHRKANGLPIPDGADDSWKDSWKPGDPIPDNMRPAPRKGGFFPQAP